MTDQQLEAIVTAFRTGLLNRTSAVDMCHAVCHPLQSYLSWAYGIATTLERVDFVAHGWSTDHCFLRLPDGRILDPTADQFNGNAGATRFPQVYVGPMPMIYQRWIDEEMPS